MIGMSKDVLLTITSNRPLTFNLPDDWRTAGILIPAGIAGPDEVVKYRVDEAAGVYYVWAEKNHTDLSKVPVRIG